MLVVGKTQTVGYGIFWGCPPKKILDIKSRPPDITFDTLIVRLPKHSYYTYLRGVLNPPDAWAII